MQLITCRVVDPARALPIRDAVFGISACSHSSRFQHEVRLGCRIAPQKVIKCWVRQSSAKALGKSPYAIPRCPRLRKHKNFRELN